MVANLHIEGICSDSEWIPFILEPSQDVDIPEPVQAEIRHITYGDVVRGDYDYETRFKIEMSQSIEKYLNKNKDTYDDIYSELNNVFFKLNFLSRDGDEEYGIKLLTCLREMELETKEIFQDCDDCPEDEVHRNEYNCHGDREAIIDIVYEFADTKKKIEDYWQSVKMDVREKNMRMGNDIDKERIKMLESMKQYNPKAYHQNINYFQDTIFICPYRIIEPWMRNAYGILCDCLDGNFNVHQWPRGQGLLKEWNKTVSVFNLIRNEIVRIRKIKEARQPAAKTHTHRTPKR